jgi:hypothetical protein
VEWFWPWGADENHAGDPKLVEQATSPIPQATVRSVPQATRRQLFSPTLRTPKSVQGTALTCRPTLSPDSARKEKMLHAGFSPKAADILVTLENSVGQDANEWAPRARTVLFSEHADHWDRLALVGFVYGNGGNLGALNEWFRVRGLLRDREAWKDVATIRKELETNKEWRARCFYYDITTCSNLNFLGQPLNRQSESNELER